MYCVYVKSVVSGHVEYRKVLRTSNQIHFWGKINRLKKSGIEYLTYSSK